MPMHDLCVRMRVAHCHGAAVIYISLSTQHIIIIIMCTACSRGSARPPGARLPGRTHPGFGFCPAPKIAALHPRTLPHEFCTSQKHDEAARLPCLHDYSVLVVHAFAELAGQPMHLHCVAARESPWVRIAHGCLQHYPAAGGLKPGAWSV